MDFSDEDLKEFLNHCDIESFANTEQRKWDEEGRLVRAAIEYLSLDSARHPGLRAALSIGRNGNDVERTLQDWGQVRRLIDAYFDILIGTLENMKKRRETERDGK